jgi:hypothetical protein
LNIRKEPDWFLWLHVFQTGFREKQHEIWLALEDTVAAESSADW